MEKWYIISKDRKGKISKVSVFMNKLNWKPVPDEHTKSTWSKGDLYAWESKNEFGSYQIRFDWRFSKPIVLSKFNGDNFFGYARFKTFQQAEQFAQEDYEHELKKRAKTFTLNKDAVKMPWNESSIPYRNRNHFYCENELGEFSVYETIMGDYVFFASDTIVLTGTRQECLDAADKHYKELFINKYLVPAN